MSSSKKKLSRTCVLFNVPLNDKNMVKKRKKCKKCPNNFRN